MDRRQLLKTGLGGLLALGVNAPSLVYSKASFSEQSAIDQLKVKPKVINAGVGGDNTVNLLARLDKDCLAHQPQLTILMVGTNDMNSVKHIPLPEYERNLEQIVRQLKAADTEILISSILPAYEPYLLGRHPAAFYQPEGVRARRIQVNQTIEQVAKRNQLYYLDLCHRFEAIGKIGTEKESLIQNELNSGKTDGIHPTTNGYRFIALSVYDFICYHQLPQTSIVCFGDSITKGDGSIDKDSYPAYLHQLLN